MCEVTFFITVFIFGVFIYHVMIVTNFKIKHATGYHTAICEKKNNLNLSREFRILFD